VLGRNGVGKSTLMLSLLGHVPLRSGKIAIRGVDVTDKLPHERVTAGLGWVPQGRECFPSLTVDEHLVSPRVRDRGIASVCTNCSRASKSASRTWQSALRRRAADAGDRARGS